MRLSPSDQKIFNEWLEHHATEEERHLPYHEQMRCHIFWLSGGHNFPRLTDEEPGEEDRIQ